MLPFECVHTKMIARPHLLKIPDLVIITDAILVMDLFPRHHGIVRMVEIPNVVRASNRP